MRIGYPCINRSIGCTSSKTFRLASYSDERLHETVAANLSCLMNILVYNVDHGLLFHRITSDLVPFASHPICTLPWKEYFSDTFAEIGAYCREHGLRISMHPDQFVLINTPDKGVLLRSIEELAYQSAVLDLMGLDRTAKVQIHVGGVYGDKTGSMDRFVENFSQLSPSVKSRLVIENDDRLFSIADCCAIHKRTGIPVILDSFHHKLLNRGESLEEILTALRKTWKDHDGLPMMDYSSQQEGKRPGAHAEAIVPGDFLQFLSDSRPHDFDLMLEIKDKEKSACAAIVLAAHDPRLVTRV
jgi:UV DNA damage endonuclease